VPARPAPGAQSPDKGLLADRGMPGPRVVFLEQKR
jgi:hypothetical protein